MGRINRVPLGLLDLLQSKTDGVNPGDLSEVVVGTIDLGEFYFSERIAHEFFQYTSAAIDDNNSITVPAGENWILWAIDVTYINGVLTDVQDVGVALERFPSAPSVLQAVDIFNTGDMVTTVAGQTSTRSEIFERPIFIPSGMIIRATTNNFVLTTHTIAINMGIYRLQT